MKSTHGKNIEHYAMICSDEQWSSMSGLLKTGRGLGCGTAPPFANKMICVTMSSCKRSVTSMDGI